MMTKMDVVERCLTVVMLLVFLKEDCYGDDRMALFGNLTQDIKTPLIPPQVTPVLVNVTTSLLQIKQLNVETQTMKSSWLFTIEWYDSRYSWDKTEFNLSKLNLPLSSAWRPDIYVHNSITGTGSEFSSGALSVDNYGKVSWKTFAHLETSCQTNSRKYPFDKQRCDIVIGSMMLDRSSLSLMSSSNYPDTSSTATNPSWKLSYAMVEEKMKNYLCCPGQFSQLVYTVVMERKTDTVMLNTVLPTALIVLISLFVFYLPPESGDKITLSALLLLCMTVFHQMIAERTPTATDDIPILCQYIALCFTVLSVNTIIAILVTKICLCANYGRRPPKWVRVFASKCLADVVCLQDFKPWPDGREKSNPEISFIANGGTSSARTNRQKLNTTWHRELRERFAVNWNHTVPEDPGTYIWADLQFMFSDMLSCLHEIRDAEVRERQTLAFRAGIKNEWKKVAMVVDRISAYIIFFVTLALCLYIFFNAYTS